jgi:phospholipid/cholesterol/gamma-HCH transport system substrate-binding protein
MISTIALRRLIALSGCVIFATTGCAFQGLNSLPLPGTVGNGSDAETYHLQFTNIGTLQSNSPVMLDDVVVGRVGKMAFSNWHIDVDVTVEPGVVVPANATAAIGQTSLLGSMHIALDPPVGESPTGRLEPGATIALSSTSTYPSTEQTLSSLAAVVNAGGLGQIGDIIHNFGAALSGREGEIRDLLTRLDNFVGTLDAQRQNIIATISSLDRLAGTFAQQRDVISETLRKVPPALDVLVRERPRITNALDKLGKLGDTATRLTNDTQADLVTNLQNLEPTIRALADVGPKLDLALAAATTYPNGQGIIDRAVKGDYINSWIIADLTVPRLKRSLFLGTRWGDEGANLVPAPGEPSYLNYTYDPLASPTQGTTPAEGAPLPAPAVLPVVPPPMVAEVTPPVPGVAASVFAGPYGVQASTDVPPSTGGG